MVSVTPTATASVSSTASLTYTFDSTDQSLRNIPRGHNASNNGTNGNAMRTPPTTKQRQLSKRDFTNSVSSFPSSSANANNDLSSSVKVAVRVRPFLSAEMGNSRCVEVLATQQSSSTAITQHQRGGSNIDTNMIKIGGETGKSFLFDVTYEPTASQRQVFVKSVLPLVEACLDGYNATVLAYGQTGSGKTYTVLGPSNAASFSFDKSADVVNNIPSPMHSPMESSIATNGSSNTNNTASQAGIIPRAIRELFRRLEILCSSSTTPQPSSSVATGKTPVEITTNNKGRPSAISTGTTETTATDTTTETTTSEHNSTSTTKPAYEYEVRVQFLEIYGEEIRDLLSTTSTKLSIRDGGGPNVEPEVIGALEVKVTSAEEALLCLTRGTLRRVTGATAMNSESSRSHAIMTVIVEQSTVIGGGIVNNNNNDSEGGEVDSDNHEEEGKTSDEEEEAKESTSNNSRRRKDESQHQEIETKVSKFHFVDLAGSERQKRSKAVGQRLREGIDINKGLLVLGNVISALGDPTKRGKAFVPYRDSKLTRLLKGSLGGNHKTLMIACVSPSSSNMEETLNCLRYANRAKNIQNNAVVNVDAGSRLVAELRTLVQALARELLKLQSRDSQSNNNNEEKNDIENDADKENVQVGAFSNDMLRALSNGKDSAVLQKLSGGLNVNLQDNTPNQGAEHSTPRGSIGAGSVSGSDQKISKMKEKFQRCIAGADAELAVLKEQLKQTKEELESKTEEVFAANAEKEFYRLSMPGNEHILPFTSTDSRPSRSKSDDAKDDDQSEGDAFMNRATAYEREIGQLKDKLRDFESGVVAATHNNDFDDASATKSITPSITSTLTTDFSEIVSSSQRLSASNRQRRKKENALAEAFEREAIAEQKETDYIARKYIKCDEDSEMNSTSLGEERMSMTLMTGNSAEIIEDKEDAFVHRQAQLDAHVLQLSKGIAAKEELIVQLNQSKNKYESMRMFYQEKLGQMQIELGELESERNHLISELRTHEENSHKFKMLQVALTSKEKQIYHLKSRESDVSKLTTISSRNETIISRLVTDVKDMKKQKASLQKQLTKERKEHTLAMQNLRKEIVAQERSAARSKQELSKTKAEKERYQKIARHNAEELSKVRSKMRETAKRARISTVKRGVMEQIGIDPVMVGRRQNRQSKPGYRMSSSKDPDALVNVDKVRSFLDGKVAEMGRKESDADKLAKEWEDHLELVTRREDILKESGEYSKDFENDEIEALDIQIQFKKDAIRQLARRLGQRPKSAKNGAVSQYSFIDNKEFKALCGDMTPLSAAKLSAKILFGMVVRERKRVAALARTASSLDQKLIESEKLITAKDSALRSHVEEAKHERAAMVQSQQEKILSLMALVQRDEGDINDCSSVETKKASSRPSDDVVLQLANERIDILENHLAELQKEKEENEARKAEEAEKEMELREMNDECQRLKGELKRMKTIFKALREKVEFLPAAKGGTAEGSIKSDLAAKGEIDSVYDQISSILDEGEDDNLPQEEYKGENVIFRKRRTTRSVEEMVSGESDDDDVDLPEWAGDIMEDLAIIAAGDVPASLKKTQGRPPTASNVQNVYERLTDPGNYTGVQKNTFSKLESNAAPKTSASRSGSRASTPQRGGHFRTRSFDQGSIVSSATSVKTSSRRRAFTQGSTPIRTGRYSQQSLDGMSASTSPKFSRGPARNRIRGGTPRSRHPNNDSDSFHPLSSTASPENVRSPKNGGPPRVVSLPNKPPNKEDEIIDSDCEEEGDGEEGREYMSNFVDEYTQTDVFERLQKRVTNSYELRREEESKENEV